MSLPRELTYKTRIKLEDFDIDTPSTLNHLIYDEWVSRLPDLNPTQPGLPERELQVFNDAYYVCTLILMHKVNRFFARYVYLECKYPSVSLPLIHLYISLVDAKIANRKRILNRLLGAIDNGGWSRNVELLKEAIGSYTGSVSPIEFAQRKITSDMLSDIPWYKTTCGFNNENTRNILKYIANTIEERHIMVDAIKNAAKEWEWEYNMNLEWVDDYGTVHKDKPADVSAFLSFCDEIRDVEEKVLSDEEDNLGGLEITNNKMKKKSGRKPIDVQTITASFNYLPRQTDKTQRLQAFYNTLKGRFIDSGTDLREFVNIFTGASTSNYIVWTRSIRELHYMINRLEAKKWITIAKGYGKWQVVCARFRNRAKKKETVDNSMTNDSYVIEALTSNQFSKDSGVPSRHNELDNALLILDPNIDYNETLQEFLSVQERSEIEDYNDALAHGLQISTRP